MALIICPDCQEQGFTWSYDEENTPPTSWSCSGCGYKACEDESFERICTFCGIKNEIRLEDDNKVYWYCHHCQKITLISEK